MSTQHCPCGSACHYEQCCKRYIELGQAAPTAEALMRSRYVAYGLHHQTYLLSTWHASTRPEDLNTREEPVPKWMGLSIKQHHQTGDQGTVEFVARYRLDVGGPAQRLHETSRFVRENNQWFYVDGDIHPS